MTIAIPTFRRPDLLVEAVRSAARQDFDRPFEIIVLDNEPTSTGAEALLAAVPELRSANFRYFVHRENVGMYGNHNLGLRLAQAEWITFLHDDDLLDPNCLGLIFGELDRRPDCDGIVSRKRILDQRDGAAQPEADGPVLQHMSRGVSVSTAWRMLRGSRHSRRDFVSAAAGRLLFEYGYRGRMTRRIGPDKLFWGAILGNGAGFVFRRDRAIALGGFYPEEFPSSDHWFYARFAKHAHLRQHRAVTCSVRKAENETVKLDTVRAGFRAAAALRHALAKGDVPAWWLRLTPMILAWHRADYRDEWRVTLPDDEIEALTGERAGKERPRMLRAIRVVLGGT